MIKALLGAALALACAGCGTFAWVYPEIAPSPLDSALDQSPRTGEAGAILHRQLMTHRALARADQPIHVVDGSRNYVIGPDNLMFAARIDTSPPRQLFCTYDTTYDGRNEVGVRAQMRTCWVDDDNNGSFDRVFAVQVGDFSRNITSFTANVTAPSAYTILAPTADRAIEFVVKFAPKPDGRNQLEVHYVDGVFETPLEGAAFNIPAQLPATLGVLGAEIELLELADGALTYRVLSGFAPDARGIVNLPY